MSDIYSTSEDVTPTLDQTFNAEMQSILRQAEDIRLKKMRDYQLRGFVFTTVSLISVTAGCAGFGWALFMEADLIRGVFALLAGFILPFLTNIWAKQPLKSYQEQYKKALMPALARSMGNLRFYPERGISEKVAKASGLLPAYHHYQAEDAFMGKYKGVKLMLSEARLRNKSTGHFVFDGIFVLLEIPKEFEGHTIFTYDRNAIQMHRKTRWKTFEEIPHSHLNQQTNMDISSFSIFSTAPLQIAQDLTEDSFKKEISEMRDLFDKAPISAAFFRKKYLFIMIPNEHDMFEPSSLHVPITSQQDALKCKKEIEQILSVIDALHIKF